MSSREWIQEAMQRKEKLILELQSYKKDVPLYQQRSQPDEPNSAPSDKLHYQAFLKETYLREIDKLKIENRYFRDRLKNVMEEEAQDSVKDTEIANCKEKILSQNIQLKAYQEKEALWQSETKKLKDEIDSLKAQLKTYAHNQASSLGEVSNTKKWENAEKVALMNQYQEIVLEVEKLRTDTEKYRDLIINIEAAVQSDKVCVVSSKGLVVTSMLDLALQVMGRKEMPK